MFPQNASGGVLLTETVLQRSGSQRPQAEVALLTTGIATGEDRNVDKAVVRRDAATTSQPLPSRHPRTVSRNLPLLASLHGHGVRIEHERLKPLVRKKARGVPRKSRRTCHLQTHTRTGRRQCRTSPVAAARSRHRRHPQYTAPHFPPPKSMKTSLPMPTCAPSPPLELTGKPSPDGATKTIKAGRRA